MVSQAYPRLFIPGLIRAWAAAMENRPITEGLQMGAGAVGKIRKGQTTPGYPLKSDGPKDAPRPSGGAGGK